MRAGPESGSVQFEYGSAAEIDKECEIQELSLGQRKSSRQRQGCIGIFLFLAEPRSPLVKKDMKVRSQLDYKFGVGGYNKKNYLSKTKALRHTVLF